MLYAILSWIVFGFLVGLIARFLFPGPVPMGILGTMVLGVAGSLLGGFIGYLFTGPPRAPFDGAGWILSILGAMALVWGGLRFGKKG